MPRTTYIWNKETRKMVEKSEYVRQQRGLAMPDISEFVTTDGVPISSRSELREYQKRTGMEQIGNDSVNGLDDSGQYRTKRKPMPDIKPVIEAAWRRHNG